MGYRSLLCILSGDDYGIIRKCPPGVKNHFAAIGLLVALISMLCFISFLFLFTGLLQSFIVGFLLSIFFTWMIINIYLLLLYMLSTRSLSKPIERPDFIVLPNFLKYGFLVFMAILVSKPLESVIYMDALLKDIPLYRQELIDKYTRLATECFEKETADIKKVIEKEMKYNDESPELESRLREYDMILKDSDRKQFTSVRRMNHLIIKSDFYTQGIIILSTKYPSSWLFTLFIIAIFLSPVILKHLLASKIDYYKFKETIELRIIAEAHEIFVRKYNEMMHTRFGESYSWQDFKEDSPLVAEKKVIYTEKELIDQIYHV